MGVLSCASPLFFPSRQSAVLGAGRRPGAGVKGLGPPPFLCAEVPLGGTTAIVNQVIPYGGVVLGELTGLGGPRPGDRGTGVPLEVRGLEKREGRKTVKPELVTTPEGSSPWWRLLDAEELTKELLPGPKKRPFGSRQNFHTEGFPKGHCRQPGDDGAVI